MKNLFAFCLFGIIFLPGMLSGQEYDTAKVYFDLNSSALSNTSHKTLIEFLERKGTDTTLRLIVNGYTDFLGTSEHNMKLSAQRSGMVRQNLVSLGVDPAAIKQCNGLGEVRRDKMESGGFPEDRRVDVIAVSIEQFNAIETISPYRKEDDLLQLLINTTPVGETFILPNVYFYPNRHTLVPESLPILQQLLVALRNNPKLKIQIEGHLCCIPITLHPDNTVKKMDAFDFDVNEIVTANDTSRKIYFRQALSVSRAKFIYDYLVDAGIPASRLKYKGLGNTRPLKVNGRFEIKNERNRRVEIRILDNG